MNNESIPTYQELLDNIEDRMYAYTSDLELIMVNRPMIDDYYQAFGVKLEPGIHVLECVPEPMKDSWKSRYARVLAGESFDQIDQFFIEGVPEYAKLSFKPIIRNGEIVGGTCHSRDVSAQLRAEQKNKENEEHLHAQINNTQESIWSVDRDYRILTINHVFQKDFETVFGIKLMKGDRVLDCFDGDLYKDWKSRYDLALSGKHFTKTDKFDFGDFQAYSEVSFNPIFVNGEVVGVAGFTRDITELVKKNQELEAAVEKAKEADKLKSAFVANISHEIRSPLNSILGFSELAFDDEYTKKQKSKFKSNIFQSGAHLMGVIDGIIDISIIESGQLDLKLERFELNTLFVESIRQVKVAKLHSSDIEFVFQRQASCWLISDQKRIRQIVINLLTNAVKFTKRGNITIGFNCDKDSVKVFVEDTGIGIPPEIGDKLFDRFYRADNTKAMATGTGLGLAISKAIIQALGGEISYKSELGVGTRFNFIIPLKPDKG